MRPSTLVAILALATCAQFAAAKITEFVRSDPPTEPELSVSLHGEPEAPVESRTSPIVFWHGMGDTAYGSCTADRKALEKKFPNVTVLSIQIGSNPAEDALSSYLGNVNRQIELVCRALLESPSIRLHGAFNAVGFSQGAQFLRGLVQRCPFRAHGIRPKNLISLGGQHQGVFGLPNCEGFKMCDYISYMVSTAAYEKSIQDHIVQAEYWHDPTNERQYRAKNVFLADINNENSVNQTYRENLMALDNLVLVQFMQDEMVIPRESSLFGYYRAGSKRQIAPVEESRLWLEDRLGLRQLQAVGGLHQIKIPGGHLQYHMSWFLNSIASVYLNN